MAEDIELEDVVAARSVELDHESRAIVGSETPVVVVTVTINAAEDPVDHR